MDRDDPCQEADSMATVASSPSVETGEFERITMDGIRWSTYEALLEDLDGRGIRLTYDRGRLEIMTLSTPHEWSKTLLARAFEVLTEELDIPIRSGGQQTFRQQLKEKGLEPDECYWIQHEAEVRGKPHISLDTDPPPDIAFEVEISESVLDRLGINAELRVPEIWRYDGETIIVAHLQDDQTYRMLDHSPSFPWLPLAELASFLARRDAMDETGLIRSFRAWVRAELAPEFRRGED
jgi:Uma2 family endonuclease